MSPPRSRRAKGKPMSEQKGVWRTIMGRKVFIADGQSLTDAMRASGKFTDKVLAAVDENEKDEKKQNRKKELGEMNKKELAEFLGPEYEGLKGQAAIEKVASEKSGHVKGAFTREDIGDIDLFWGNNDVGLQHIISHRKEQGINVDGFLEEITEVVEKGAFGGPAKAPDSFIFRTKDKTAVISYTYKGNDIQYLLTAFKSSGGGKGKKKPPQ